MANNRLIGLTEGPEFASFDELRGRHVENFARIEPGQFAKLKVKRRNFVIVNEDDYQRLQAAADEVGELAEQLEALKQAISVARKHQDAGTIALLESVANIATRTIDNYMEKVVQPLLKANGIAAEDLE
jgi:vacuolar-type H+-ATPase subunit F/Vma7